MRVLICGGRTYGLNPDGSINREVWRKATHTIEGIALDRFPRLEPDSYGNFLFDVTIIEGGAKGADQIAADWAVVNWCELLTFPAEWKKYRKAAGYIRNKKMLEKGRPDLVIAFPGGPGTKMMVDLARAAGVEVIEVN